MSPEDRTEELYRMLEDLVFVKKMEKDDKKIAKKVTNKLGSA